MYRAIAAALALGSLAARAALGYGPVDCFDAPPCGCEPVIVCDPCAVTSTPTPPRAPDQLPAPRKPDSAKQQPAEAEPPTPAPGANEFPFAPNVNAPDVERPASTPESPPSPRVEAPAEVQPATPESPADETPAATEPPATPEQPAPAADESRYSTPPAEEPTTPATDAYEGLFPPDDAAGESATPAAETPAIESPAADQAPAPDNGEESPRTPDYDELFPPSSSTGVMSAPGGWAGVAPRSWQDADGRVLATGRIAGVTPQRVVLACENGAEQTLPYAALSNDDLRFLRDQVAARRTEVQTKQEADRLLAGQQ